MSRLTLRNIEIFIAAVEEGSVAAAARRLATSPSSISQHLSNLEEDLGTILVDRTARPLALTPAGVLFRRRAANILTEASRARAELAVFDYTNLTQLSLAVIDDFEPDVTPALMASLSAEMPDCQMVLQTGASHANLSALESRSVDMCIAAEPDTPEEWMEIYPLLNEPFVLLAPKGEIDPSLPSLPQLMAKPFIRFPKDQVVGRLIEASPQNASRCPANLKSIATSQLWPWLLTAPAGPLPRPCATSARSASNPKSTCSRSRSGHSPAASRYLPEKTRWTACQKTSPTVSPP